MHGTRGFIVCNGNFSRRWREYETDWTAPYSATLMIDVVAECGPEATGPQETACPRLTVDDHSYWAMPAADILQRFRTNELARFLNSHRIFFYTLVSLVSVSAVIINALKNYSNFYSVAIYLSKSSRSVLVRFPTVIYG